MPVEVDLLYKNTFKIVQFEWKVVYAIHVKLQSIRVAWRGTTTVCGANEQGVRWHIW